VVRLISYYVVVVINKICVGCSDKVMRILFVVRSIGYGGASKQLALTANAMSDYGHEVAIYSYNYNDIQQSLKSTVKYIPENNVTNNSIQEYLMTPGRIRRQLKIFKPDVLISWRANAGCMCILASLGIPVKTIFSERTDPYMETNSMLKIATKVCRLSNGGVFQTTKARDYYGKLASRSTVIPNPIDKRIVLPKIVEYSNRPKKIAFVGRFFMKQKRQDVMLDAFKEILNHFPDYRLSFYGDGGDLDTVKNMAIEKGIENSVIFHGAVTNVIDHIKDARLLIMTSDYEGIPNTIIEAFMAGVPVVSTDCSPGGARTLIDDGVNGYLVNIRDCVSIAEQAGKVLNSAEVANRFIENGRKKLDELQPEKIFDEWNNYICRIAASN